MRGKEAQNLYIPAPKLNKLHILTQIAADPGITQAELAQRCALSVAMVNNYMKELCSGGLLEYRRRSSKSISYYLTAAGKEAVDATQGELLLALAAFFRDAKRRICDLILGQTRAGLRRVILYGTGDLAEMAFHALESANINIVGVCDDDASIIGRDWCGRELMSPQQIRFLSPDCVIVASLGRADEICDSLDHLHGRGIQLVRLDGRDGYGEVQETAQSGKSEQVASS